MHSRRALAALNQTERNPTAGKLTGVFFLHVPLPAKTSFATEQEQHSSFSSLERVVSPSSFAADVEPVSFVTAARSHLAASECQVVRR